MRNFFQWLRDDAEMCDGSYVRQSDLPRPSSPPRLPVAYVETEPSPQPAAAPPPVLVIPQPDPSRMNLAAFRHTEVYEKALLTPSVLNRNIPYAIMQGVRGPYRPRNALSTVEYIHEAGLRLNHLIRNALNPMYHEDFPNIRILSAIKLFVDAIEQKLQSTSTTLASYDFVNHQLVFCRELLRQANRVLSHHNHNPVSSDGFRQLIITHGCKIDSVVFFNPLYDPAGLFSSDFRCALSEYWK